MHKYETPQPVHVTLSLGYVVANIQVTAGDRADTTIEVVPSDPSSKADVKVAEQTRVEQVDGQVLVKAPKLSTLFSRSGAIDVTVELPNGSTVTGESGMGSFITEGLFAECRFKTGFGPITVEEAGSAVLASGSGDVTVGHIAGEAEVKTATGTLRIRQVDGPATVKNSNGATWIGDVAGDVQVIGANGSITVDRARSNAILKTANGSVHIGEVFRGSVTLETASGGLEVGVHEGTAAWLDLNTVAGRVRSELDSTNEPGRDDETVQVRARTYVGDIVVRRA